MTQTQVKRPVLIGISVAAVFMINLMTLMVGPLLVDMSKDFGISIAVAGQIATFTAIPWIAVAVLGGPISDTYGRKPVLMVGMISLAVSAIGMGLSVNFGMAAVFRMLMGFAGTVPTTAIAIVSDFVPPNQRGRAVGAVTFGSSFGGIIGLPLVALTSDLLSWRWSFILTGIVTIIVGLAIFLVMPSPPRRRGVKIDFISRMRPLFKQGIVWDISLVNIFSRTGLMVMMTYVASFLIIKHGYTTGDTAIPLAVISIGLMISSVVGGRLVDSKFRLSYVPFAMVLAAVTGLATYWLNFGSWLVIFFALVFVGAIYIPFMMVLTAFSIIGGEKLKGTAIGMVPISNQIGFLLGPALGGLALSMGNYEAVGLLCLGIGALGALSSVLRLRQSKVEKATLAVSRYQKSM